MNSILEKLCYLEGFSGNYSLLARVKTDDELNELTKFIRSIFQIDREEEFVLLEVEDETTGLHSMHSVFKRWSP